jgi:hypothetical protein
MAKPKKTAKEKVPAPPPPSEALSPLGKRVVAAGGALVLLGFAVLSRADAAGRNWAASLAPFLILGGYAAVGIGLFLPPEPAPPSSAPTPKYTASADELSFLRPSVRCFFPIRGPRTLPADSMVFSVLPLFSFPGLFQPDFPTPAFDGFFGSRLFFALPPVLVFLSCRN